MAKLTRLEKCGGAVLFQLLAAGCICPSCGLNLLGSYVRVVACGEERCCLRNVLKRLLHIVGHKHSQAAVVETHTGPAQLQSIDSPANTARTAH